MNNANLSPIAKYEHIAGLNGVRAISVLIVIVSHMGLKHIIPGGFGVTIFFFISGFLITRLLIAEHEAKGRIILKQFYMRRFIRLYPALLFMVFGTIFLYFIFGWGGPTPLETLSAVFYGTNIYQVGARMGGNAPFMPWKHLWSLAVEEHFYLIFPAFLVMLSGKWDRILKAAVLILAAALLWRVYIFTQTAINLEEYTYMMTDTRIDSLVWGCVLSIMLHVQGNTKKLSWLMGYLPAAAALMAIFVSFLIRDEAFRYTARFSLQGLALFILFLNLFFSAKFRWLIAVLEWAPLAWFGTVSYALYLWHIPIIDICMRFMGEGPLTYLMAFAVSIYAAAFSYYIVEKRFLVLRKAYGSYVIVKPPLKNNLPKAIAKTARFTKTD